MKEIIFHKVGFENFCSYQERFEYEFKNQKILMIVGRNGTGKTTIFIALSFALYGETSKDLSVDDVVNNKSKKNCYVYTEFSCNDDMYKVERFVKYTKIGNSVNLFKNNELIAKGDKEVVKYIENLIGPYKLFTNTIFFAQNASSFFTDLKNAQQKEIFKRILQLDNYEKYYALADRELKNYVSIDNGMRDELMKLISKNETLNGNLKEVEDRKRIFNDNKKNKILEYNKQIENINIQINLLSGKKDAINLIEFDRDKSREALIKLKSKIDGIKTDKENETSKLLAEYNKKKSELDSRYKDKKMEIQVNTAALKAEADNIKTDYINKSSELNSKKLNISNIADKIKNLNIRILENQKRKDEILSTLSNTHEIKCYTCGQIITDENKINEIQLDLSNTLEEENRLNIELINLNEQESLFQAESSSLEYELKILTSVYNDKKIEIENTTNNAISNLDNLFNSSIKKLDEILKEKEKLLIDKYKTMSENDILEYNKLLQEYKINEESLNTIEKCNKEIILHENDIAKFTALINEVEKQEFDDSIKNSILLQIKDNNYNIKRIESEKDGICEQIKALEFWKKGFSMSGIPAMLIDEAIPFMNERVQFYLNKIGARYKVSFDTVKETKAGDLKEQININVFDTETLADSRSQLSSGQKRLIDIATIFTLRDLQSVNQGMSVNIILLDEVFDSLDDTNISAVSNLLREIIKNNVSINLISHRQIDNIEVDEILTL